MGSWGIDVYDIWDIFEHFGQKSKYFRSDEFLLDKTNFVIAKLTFRGKNRFQRRVLHLFGHINHYFRLLWRCLASVPGGGAGNKIVSASPPPLCPLLRRDFNNPFGPPHSDHVHHIQMFMRWGLQLAPINPFQLHSLAQLS